MDATHILTNAAIIFLAVTFWSDLKETERLSPAKRTWLLVACIFAVVSIAVRFLP